MTNTTPQPTPSPHEPHGHATEGQVYVEPLDPANQSLADALRKSFGVLKFLMLVLVVLYFLSGWFSVKPDEVGLVTRYGRIVGIGAGEETAGAVLYEGWHWSWPYPFERWITVSTKEREIPVEFMFQLSESEMASGITGYGRGSLSPVRDDYLITGDVNILHASLRVKYKITDAVAYLKNVYPMSDLEATIRSKEHRRYPEYGIVTNLVRNSVIETAAQREALKIRGEDQDAFLSAVALRLNDKLKELEERDAALGIYVDKDTGIIAPKTSNVEAIMPPRQTQQIFDRVQAAGDEKAADIAKAQSGAQAMLVQMAGPDYERIAEATEKEFALMRRLSKMEGVDGSAGNGEEIQRLRAELREQRGEVEELLTTVASGKARAILRDAEIARDTIIKEAAGDYAQFIEVRPEYEQDPAIFMSRRLDEAYADALDNWKIAKVYVPAEAKDYRLHIPRAGKPVLGKEKEGDKARSDGLMRKPELVVP
ncbi:MAG: hypothetical protein JXQ75_06645 [Phycisphaerae bacterium]|nr:hypothetical protein [Phycisphaerae bacterium]